MAVCPGQIGQLTGSSPCWAQNGPHGHLLEGPDVNSSNPSSPSALWGLGFPICSGGVDFTRALGGGTPEACPTPSSPTSRWGPGFPPLSAVDIDRKRADAVFRICFHLPCHKVPLCVGTSSAGKHTCPSKPEKGRFESPQFAGNL